MIPVMEWNEEQQSPLYELILPPYVSRVPCSTRGSLLPSFEYFYLPRGHDDNKTQPLDSIGHVLWHALGVARYPPRQLLKCPPTQVFARDRNYQTTYNMLQKQALRWHFTLAPSVVPAQSIASFRDHWPFSSCIEYIP